MPTRSRDWNETMSKKLHNHHYAHKFILALLMKVTIYKRH